MMKESIHIRDIILEWNPEINQWQVDYERLGDLRMIDIPAHSHLNVLGIELPKDVDECEVWILNRDDEDRGMYGGVTIRVTQETAQRSVDRLHRAFQTVSLPVNHSKSRTEISLEKDPERGLQAHAYFSLDFGGYGETTVRDALDAYLSPFRRLMIPFARIFLCHASEDKETVRLLADFIVKNGRDVWLDEREIKVGQSIVEAINAGLTDATHLAVVLSKHSIDKPWVKKELSSALMRQLAKQSISILPLLIDDSPIPPLLSDIKYADCRFDLEKGFKDLVDSTLTRAD